MKMMLNDTSNEIQIQNEDTEKKRALDSYELDEKIHEKMFW
jgi:hypothetical protein